MSKLAAQLVQGSLRITAIHQGKEKQKTFYKKSLLLGRANGTAQPDFDLSRDNTVSRSHARLSVDDGHCWIEDLGSKFGTTVDGQDIRGKGKVRIQEGSEVQIGDTTLKIERPAECPWGFVELPPQSAGASSIEIDRTCNSASGRFMLSSPSSLQAVERQALLLEILVQFSLPAPLNQLLQTIIGRVVDLVPGAKRGSLLLRHPETDRLMLAAFVSSGEPAVSETLARRALKQREAFVWRNSFGSDPAMSIQRHQIESGMYAPLIYDGSALGVLCVDNSNAHAAFSDDDLQLLVTVADHAAMAVSHHQLREELEAKTRLIEWFVTKFGPKPRDGEKVGGGLLTESEAAALAKD